MKPIYYSIPFANFLIAALLGVLLRSIYVFPIEGMTFLYVLHAHSHLALLGWLYMLVYVLLVEKFAVKNPKEEKFYQRLFWVTQVSVMGMAVTFPFQGYAAPSIFFSTLHIICSYLFVYRLWRYNVLVNNQLALLVKTALFLMVLSTIGIWFLGPAVGMMGKTSPFYQLCIQFFLHFQFDGWFLTAFLALLYTQVFREAMNKQHFQHFYILWIASVLLSYALPVSWYIQAPFLYYINSLAVVLQGVAVLYWIKPLLYRFNTLKKESSPFTTLLLLLAGSCMLLRIGTQFIVLSEQIAVDLKGLRSWIVGFIHLNMLGILTAFGLWLLIHQGKMRMNSLVKAGIISLVIGFLFTEGLLFVQGVQLLVGFTAIESTTTWTLLFWFSVFLPLSISCFLGSYLQKDKR